MKTTPETKRPALTRETIEKIIRHNRPGIAAHQIFQMVEKEISAAPDLLNMLTRLMDEVMMKEECFRHVAPLTLEHARAAIARATKAFMPKA